MENWVLLTLVGLAIAWHIFMLGGYEDQFWSTKLRENPKDFELLREQLNRRNSNAKSVLVVFLITSLVAGNWAYNGEKKDKEDQQSAISRVLELPGQGWCGNFEDIDWNGETAVKTGGWPCIYISNVESIDFKEEDGIKELCMYLSFDIDSGLPGSNTYNFDLEYQEYCLSKDRFGGWSTYALEEKVGDFVRPKLDDLVQELCSTFSYRLTEGQYYTYCSG
jgi:hypothetical protein